MCISDWSSDVCSSDLVHLYCPVGGVFSLGFTRYKPEGDKLFDCEGIYAVTNNDGRWAIEMVSTLIHGRGFEGDPHPDAETEARLASEGYLAAFGYRNETLPDDRTNGRGSFVERLPVVTRPDERRGRTEAIRKTRAGWSASQYNNKD